jgi:hypothetical protein
VAAAAFRVLGSTAEFQGNETLEPCVDPGTPRAPRSCGAAPAAGRPGSLKPKTLSPNPLPYPIPPPARAKCLTRATSSTSGSRRSWSRQALICLGFSSSGCAGFAGRGFAGPGFAGNCGPRLCVFCEAKMLTQASAPNLPLPIAAPAPRRPTGPRRPGCWSRRTRCARRPPTDANRRATVARRLTVRALIAAHKWPGARRAAVAALPRAAHPVPWPHLHFARCRPTQTARPPIVPTPNRANPQPPPNRPPTAPTPNRPPRPAPNPPTPQPAAVVHFLRRPLQGERVHAPGARARGWRDPRGR